MEQLIFLGKLMEPVANFIKQFTTKIIFFQSNFPRKQLNFYETQKFCSHFPNWNLIQMQR